MMDYINLVGKAFRHLLTFESLLTVLFQNNLHLTVSALLAAAFVWMSELPSKLNPIILPIMSSIKREQV